MACILEVASWDREGTLERNEGHVNKVCGVRSECEVRVGASVVTDVYRGSGR